MTNYKVCLVKNRAIDKKDYYLMREIKSYLLVEARSADELILETNLLLGENYQPFGGISVSSNGEAAFYAQAMVLYETPDEVESRLNLMGIP